MKFGNLEFGGRVDRYVVRLFALSYLTAFVLVLGLYLIIDMAINLDEYLQPSEDGTTASTLLVLRFYALQTPFLYLQLSPFVALVAGLFTAARVTKNNEVVAALSAGVSVRRMFLTVFLGAVALAVGMFALREWATGELGPRRDVLLDRLLEQRPRPVYENFSVLSAEGRLLHIREYLGAGEGGESCEMRGVSYRFREGGRSTIVRAEVAVPAAKPGLWLLPEGGEKLVVDREARKKHELDLLEGLTLTPEDIELAWRGKEKPLELSFGELESLLAAEPSNPQFRTLYQVHLSFPLAGLVLLAVGLPFVLSQRRSKGVERVALGFLLCVVYFAVDFVSRTLGMQGLLGPLFAGWLPVLFFGSLGAVLFGSVRS